MPSTLITILFLFATYVNFVLYDSKGTVNLIYLSLVILLVCISLLTNNKILLLSSALIYFPFSKLEPYAYGPGINLTNFILITFIIISRNNNNSFNLDKVIKISLIVMAFFAVISYFNSISSGYVNSSIITSYFIQTITPWVFFLIMVYFIESLKDVRDMISIAWYGFFGSLIYGYYEYDIRRYYNTLEKSRIGGVFLQPNTYASFITYFVPMSVLLFIEEKIIKKIFIIVITLLSIKMLMATFSRGGYLAIFIPLLFICFIKNKILTILLFVVFIFLIFSYPQIFPDSIRTRIVNHTFSESVDINNSGSLDKSSTTRLVLWSAALEMIKESPLIGSGFLSFDYLSQNYIENKIFEKDTHNMYLKIAVTMGLPALFFYLLFLVRLVYMSYFLYKKSCNDYIVNFSLGAIGSTFSLLVSCMFGSRMENLELVYYLMCIYAAVNFLYLDNVGKCSNCSLSLHGKGL